ncbi:MAG: hypothetical protein WC910_05255 [Bacteroidales bacterium]|jgi:hypothetical protein
MRKSEIIPVDHEMRSIETTYIGMLLPFGYYKNSRIAECEIGSTCITLDNVKCTLISRGIVIIPSTTADCLAYMLYGMNMQELYEKMAKNWIGEVFEDRVLFIVLKRK